MTTLGGTAQPVRWLGKRRVSARFADPLRAYPIRLRAGALADGVPSRDLLLSPDHALLVDGILAQAGALVNGISIVRETEVPESFTYYHVEVADHSLILAEDTPAETFIDNVDRMAFDNWEEYVAVVGETSIPEMECPAPRPRAKCRRPPAPASPPAPRRCAARNALPPEPTNTAATQHRPVYRRAVCLWPDSEPARRSAPGKQRAQQHDPEPAQQQ